MSLAESTKLTAGANAELAEANAGLANAHARLFDIQALQGQAGAISCLLATRAFTTVSIIAAVSSRDFSVLVPVSNRGY